MYLLKLILLVIFPIIHGNNINNTNILQNFLLDYFEDKNVTITLKLCWNRNEINNLILKLFNSKYPRQVQVNTDFKNTDFFNTMAHDTFVVLDVTCNNANNILLKANTSDKFAAPYKWLLIQTTQNYSRNFDSYQILLNPFLIQIDSEVICTELIENNDILLWLYFKINENRTIEREKLGKWNHNSGLQIQISHNITSFRRRNLYGSKIRISSVMSNPDTINNLENYKNPMIDTITKTQYRIVMTLIQYINATPYMIPVDQWGVIDDKTGRWGGMCGYIERKEADISGTAVLFFKKRLKIAKFLKLTNPSSIQFILRKPPLSIEQNIYSLPFSWSVWISSISLIIIITLLFLLSSYFENPRNQDNEKVKLGNIILLMGAAVCQQGCDVVPTGVPGRILTLLVFTSFMFLYVSYSANIVALLQSSSESIKTLEDLLNSKNMKVGCHNISYNYQYFQNSTERVKKALYKEKIGPRGYFELQDGIEKVRQGLFAFHVEEGSAYYYILKTFEEHEKCDTISIPSIDEQLGWLISRLGSPHTELFKIGLYKIGEFGIQQKFFLRFYRKSKCYSSAASFTSVGITEFYPALQVFLYGLICAIFIFFMEHLHYKYMKKQQAFVFSFK